VVFESLGRLHSKSAKGRDAPAPLTGDPADVLEAFPAFSRDGSRLAYVRWNDETLGEIILADASGQNRRVLTGPGHFGNLAFSPDGSMIAFEKRSGGFLTAPAFSESAGIYVMPTDGSGQPRLVTRDGANPQWGTAGDRLFLLASDGGKLALISTDLNGEAKRIHARGELANDMRIAPDGRTIAFRQNYEVFAMPLIPGGKPVDVSEKGGALPVTKVSSGGADYLGWARGGETLFWSIGPSLQSANTSEFFAALPKAEADKTKPFTPPTTGIPLGVTAQTAKPSGTTVITGARVLTMRAGLDADDAGAIENGMIVIEGDRITGVHDATVVKMTFPEGTRFIDASGKTIMPGLVDAHAHGPYGVGDLIPQQNWTLLQDLALGVTTVHNPSSQASTVFAAAERQRAGLTLGPRIFSTGEIIYGAKAPDVYARIDSYEDALAHVRRIKAQGGISVKNYNQPRREQRQMVARAAAAENMLVVAEGGSLFGMDMNLVADGNSTIEHNVPVDVFYEDVLQFFGQSNSNYTPTLVVTYGGLAGDPYWRQAMDVFDHPLMVHTPPKALLAATGRRTKAPEWAFVDDNSAREARKLAQRGIKVSIGAHGQQSGIGAHWELWSFVRGGMSAVEALKAGTIASAQSLGMAKDIGSIEPGKLADLVILSNDPSQDIANSDDVEQVMLGGRLYDAKTLNEVGTGTATRKAYWWEANGGNGAGGSAEATSEGLGHADGDDG
jgi:imidazolonepropionase-like amidohydrolase